ncbi:MAG: Rieske (2Fe-2S) protein [Anaerolineae bacterium]
MSTDTTPNQKEVTRREFLYYTWLSSITTLIAGSAGATLAFLFPRFRAGEFGGQFVVGKVEDFSDGSMTLVREGKFFLVRLGDEFKALYQVCTHLGCLVRQAEEGFSCPCHGSRFAKDGMLLSSPAPRDLDSFAVEVVDGNVIVDTGQRTRGQLRSV